MTDLEQLDELLSASPLVRRFFRKAIRKAARAGAARERAKFDELLDRHLGVKQLNGSGPVFKADWEEDKHPRNHGKFSSSPGATGDGHVDAYHGSKISNFDMKYHAAGRGGYRYWTADQEHAARYAGEKGTIISSKLRIRNPLDLMDVSGPDEITAEEAAKILSSKGVDVEGLEFKDLAPMWRQVQSDGVKYRLQDAGFDAIVISEKGNDKSYFIMDDAQIVRNHAKAISDPDHAPDGDAVALAMLEYAAEAAELGEDPTDGLQAILDKAHGETVEKAFDESKHPRDDHGRFVSGDAINDAKGDPTKAAELRARVNRPEERAKLDAALEGKTTIDRSKRGQQKQEAGQRRALSEQDRAKASELIGKLSDANAKPGTVKVTKADLHRLAAHIPHMTTDELRRARVAMRANFRGESAKLGMSQALVSHAKRMIAERTKPRADRASTGTLYDVVRRAGGLDPTGDSLLGYVSNVSEAREMGLSLGLFKTGGRGLDELADELHITGDIVVPEGVSKSEYLLDKLKEKAYSQHKDISAQHEESLDEYYRAQQEAADYEAQSAIAESVRSGEADADTETASGEVGTAGESTGAETSNVGDLDMSNLHEYQSSEPDTGATERWTNAPRRAARAAQVKESVSRVGEKPPALPTPAPTAAKKPRAKRAAKESKSKPK